MLSFFYNGLRKCQCRVGGVALAHATPSLCAGNVLNGQYRYIGNMLRLEATATGQGQSNFRPATPLNLSAWRQALASHPDSTFVSYIPKGIAEGFHIGADRSAVQLIPIHSNMISIRQHPQLVDSQISEEREAGRLLGPVSSHLARKCRLIVDLSSPAGHSINDAISVDSCYVHYALVLDAARLISCLGVGTMLAKVDLQHAYGPS